MVKVEVVAPARPDVQVTLGDREALVLRRICARVGGGSEGARGVLDQIASLLDSIGVTRERAAAEVRCQGDIDVEWIEREA